MANEENLSVIDNNLVDLRQKLTKEAIQSNCRSKIIGGLNEEDVKKYIANVEEKCRQIEDEMKPYINELLSLQKEFEIYKNTTREEKKNLQESLEEAQNNLAFYMDKCKNLDTTLQSLHDQDNSENAQLKIEKHKMEEERKELKKLLGESRQEIEQIKINSAELKQENDVLKSKIDSLKKEISTQKDKEDFNKDVEEYKKKIISLEETIEKNKREIEELSKINENTEKALKLEKTQLSNCKVNGFKDEIMNLHNKLESITEEQIQINTELQEQLNFEQERANTAEQQLAELNNWASELKNILFSKQNVFENQFTQITEKYTQFQTEVNQYFSSLQDVCNINKQK